MKPMLAVNAPSLTEIRYPVLASPKLDGVRCLTYDGKAVTRNGKPIGNTYIRTTLEQTCAGYGLDGELVTLDADGNIKGFNECSGDIRRSTGTPDFAYLVFDCIAAGTINKPFTIRLATARERVAGMEFVRVVPHVLCATVAEVEEFEEYCVSEGYEGIMLRRTDGPYKHGRSTAKEQFLLKVKRFEDDEGEVWDYEPLVLKDGTVDNYRAGALMVNHRSFGTIKLGTGFTDAQRRHIVSHRHLWVGQQVTFKYQPSGMNEHGKPRFPVFKGIRHEE